MTFDLSAPTQGSRTRFDSGPLSWVIDEIRDALNQSRLAVQSAIGKDSESSTTLLNQAGAYLHQAHGALQIVDVDGAIIITEAVEDILHRIATGQIPLSRPNQRVIEQSYQALIEYLEELLSGDQPQPIRLFPYYRELQTIRGSERIHPADLFFLDIEVQDHHAPQVDDALDTPLSALNFWDLRPRFELALLNLLTSEAAPANSIEVADLINVVATIQAGQNNTKARDFWWVMHGFADMVATSQYPVDLFTKLACCRLNRQIRLLAQGSSSVSDRLLLDALYCVAVEENPSPLAKQIKSAYYLHDLIPSEFEKKRYGQVDTVALGMAKSALTQAKNSLPQVFKKAPGSAESFASMVRQLISASTKLNCPPLIHLLKALDSVSDQISESIDNNLLGLEIATDLLFIENTLDHLNRLSADFPKHVDALVSRLALVASGKTPPKASQWLDNLAQQSQQRQTIAVLSAEMETGLRQVEKLIDDYFKDSTHVAALAEIDPVLHQIYGVLSVLGQEDAMLAVQHTQASIREYKEALEAIGDGDKSSIEFPPTITQNITALGFLIEILPQHPESAKTRFFYNSSQGVLHANLLERGVPRPSALSTADPSFDPLLDDDGVLNHAKLVSARLNSRNTSSGPATPLPETDEEIDAELLEIFMSEAEEVLGFVKRSVPEARAHASDQDQLSTLRRSFHTLKGSGRMVGLTAFAEAAYCVEQVMNIWLADSRSGTSDLFALLDISVEELGTWVADLRRDGKSTHTAAQLSKAAERVKAGLAPLEGNSDQTLPVVHAQREADSTHSAQGMPDHSRSTIEQDGQHANIVASPATITTDSQTPSTNVIELRGSPTNQPTLDDNIKRIGSIEIGLPLFNIFIAEADDLLRYLSQDFSEWRHEPTRYVSSRAIHAAHSLAGSSATVGLTAIQEISLALELYLLTLEQQPMTLTAAEFDVLQFCVDHIKKMMQQVALSEMPSGQAEVLRLLNQLQQHAATPSAKAPKTMEPGEPEVKTYYWSDQDVSSSEDSAHDSMNENEDDSDLPSEIKDQIDPELLSVFLDEGRDLLPHIGEALRGWHQDPADTRAVPDILRYLHTTKGSARMAGAMSLGENLHIMETQIENILRSGEPTSLMLEDLLARHDYNTLLFDYLQNPGSEKPKPLSPSLPIPVLEHPSSAPSLIVTRQSGPASQIASPVARVRVRADILDRLVNQAGEVSIARSKIENEVDTLRHSLTDLTDNLSRLRSQLREVEIQAESQIASRMTQSSDREFDPLEFDRFSRLQELTRMMTESVDDVASIQDSLVRTVTGATSDLENQAQLTRSLQHDLMQVRMVPFSSISERLYQITRQASKEVAKAVSLDIRGTSVEMDRGVLERMSGPLEHLLRNAIVHGIESREDRKKAGKNETGELLVEIRQEGNEVVIQLSDDGGGLDLSRIREKAIASGLIASDRDLSDAELETLIFQNGFSTVGEVTELAGRGIGLDVVRAEAASLGGRVNVSSDPGKGTRFTINLPLTLAVTSVVLISTGGNTYAVPSVLVEQVQQLRSSSLIAAYNDGYISWLENRVPIFFLSALLGDTHSTPVVQQYTPVVILKSGADRVAIHVDEIVGNREVVVKNIGPQLARMIGIVGATVLGSGNIVLILDPVPLAQRVAFANVPAPRIVPSDTEDEDTLTAGIHSDSTVLDQGSPSTSQPIQGLRKKNIVMVVDDSLTVRRVTQRFLQREGYQVILAKDGVDALEKLQDVKPDVMLVDIEMPRMDGFDLIRNVRSDARIAKTPIIMITSRTASKHRNYAMELGANEYYGKPFQENQLLESIEEFVSKERKEEV